MDDLGHLMYFPVMVQEDLVSGIIPLSGPLSPIGNAEFGGRLRGTPGTGLSQFRVYGMYALVFLLEGGGRYRDRRGMDRRLSRGDLVVVFPEHPHQYGPEGGENWDEVFIAFKGLAFEGWRSHGLDPANPVWRLDSPRAMARRFFEILRMPTASLAESTAMAAAIHRLIADALAQRPLARENWLEKAKQLLDGGTEAPTPQEIAARSGMSHDYFRKCFKTATGESPSSFRRRRRLAQAALMLQRSDLKLDMIAESLGFCDGFHLSKAFKKEFGKSPAEYRSNLPRVGGKPIREGFSIQGYEPQD
jgi:AraC-like DNA-binding protein